MTSEDPGNRHPSSRTKPIGPTAQDYATQHTTSRERQTRTKNKEEQGNYRPLTTPPEGPWSRNMPNYGQLRRNPGTNTVLLETKNTNLQVKTKIDLRAEDCAPPKDTSPKT